MQDRGPEKGRPVHPAGQGRGSGSGASGDVLPGQICAEKMSKTLGKTMSGKPKILF